MQNVINILFLIYCYFKFNMVIHLMYIQCMYLQILILNIDVIFLRKIRNAYTKLYEVKLKSCLADTYRYNCKTGSAY